jgi:ketosteroid isomerase-like protein
MTTTTETRTIATLDHELNRLILAGGALEGFERFYSDDIVMRENNGEPSVGKTHNRKKEEDFFGSVETLHALELVSEATGEDVSFSEWVFDLTFKGGNRKRLEQTSVRRWRDGEIVEERFYYDPS